jgi:hypothetical protein
MMTDFDTEVAKHKIVGRWSHGCIDGTPFFGNIPT